MNEQNQRPTNHNANAVLYDDHDVNYPQHLRRCYWVQLSHEGRVVIRDDPDRKV